jgi:hypothetical protein
MIRNNIIIAVTLCIVLITTLANAQYQFQPNAPHGVIKYRLIEVSTNKTLSEQTLYINKINTRNRHIPLGKYFEDRYINIYDDFIVGLNNYGYKSKNGVNGFGIWLDRSNHDTFSWEWYNQITTNKFDKLQGNGKLKVEYRQRNDYWEISKMTFIGDQILRAKKKGCLSEIIRIISRGPEKDWYCIILDGSYIIW